MTAERDREIRAVLRDAELETSIEPESAQDQTIRRRWQCGLEAYGLGGAGEAYLYDRYVLNEPYGLVGRLSRYLTVTAPEGLRAPNGDTVPRRSLLVTAISTSRWGPASVYDQGYTGRLLAAYQGAAKLWEGDELEWTATPTSNYLWGIAIRVVDDDVPYLSAWWVDLAAGRRGLSAFSEALHCMRLSSAPEREYVIGEYPALPDKS